MGNHKYWTRYHAGKYVSPPGNAPRFTIIKTGRVWVLTETSTGRTTFATTIAHAKAAADRWMEEAQKKWEAEHPK